MVSILVVSNTENLASGKQRLCAIFPVAGLTCLMVLSACIGPAPAMRDSRTAVVSGRETAGLSTTDATQKALTEAAKVTVDHGFRYFMIISPQNTRGGNNMIQPGADIAIKTFRKGEIRLNTPGIWDADVILSSGFKNRAVSTKKGGRP